MKRVLKGWILAVAVLGAVVNCGQVLADDYSSTSYKINGTVGANFGGSGNSATYDLVYAGGENAIGNGASGSYKMGMGYVSQLDRSLQLTVQPNGLAGYYPFSEPSGAYAYDQSVAANRINLVAQTFTTGKVGGGLQLDGTTNAAVSADATAYNFQSNDFTVEYWEDPLSAAVTRDVMGKWEAGVGGFAVAIVNGAPQMSLNNTGVSRACSSISTSTWSHIAFVKQGTNLNCYVNGVLANGALTGTVPANIGSTALAFKLGGGRYGTSAQDGLDEVKLYTRALTAAEVLAEYSAGNAGIPGGVSLGAITPGVSNVTLADTIVRTDASGYSLLVSQNHDLQNGANTIPAITGGTIASPQAWIEGTTKGLGFSLNATNASAIPGAWGSGANYAAFPGATTQFYTRTGVPSGGDYLTLKLRADVSSSTPANSTPYTNTITVTGVMTP